MSSSFFIAVTGIGGPAAAGLMDKSQDFYALAWIIVGFLKGVICIFMNDYRRQSLDARWQCFLTSLRANINITFIISPSVKAIKSHGRPKGAL
jgi:hypothetical protein